MGLRKSLSARLLAAHLLLLGLTAAGAALAQEAAPAAGQSDAEANPIDTSITTQPPAHFKRGAKAHSVRKFAIVNPQANSGHHHRNLLRGNEGDVVRNSIGLPLQPATADVKGIQPPQVSEPPSTRSAGKAASAPGTGGTEGAGTVPHHQEFVPLQTRAVTPNEPRLNTAMNRSIVNGRDMVHPGLGASMIGGAAKSSSGVIAGSDFRSKHSASQ